MMSRSRSRSRSPQYRRHTSGRNRDDRDRRHHRHDSRTRHDGPSDNYESFDTGRQARSRGGHSNYPDHSKERCDDRQRYDDRHTNSRPTYRPLDRPNRQTSKDPSTGNSRVDGTRLDSAEGKKGGEVQLQDTNQDTKDPSNEVDDEEQMMSMMGFGGFGSTKGDKVKGNVAGAVARAPKRVEYRQYMNRAGGFNRPLDEKSAV